MHDKQASDDAFLAGLALIRKAADDERHFVKKAVNMALRATGKRNAALHRAAIELARELAASANRARTLGGRTRSRTRQRRSPTSCHRRAEAVNTVTAS